MSGTTPAINNLLLGLYGKHGGLFIDDTDAHAGKWVKITIAEAAVFHTLTISGFTGTVTGISFPAGSDICGDITAIKLTSGSCTAYKQ